MTSLIVVGLLFGLLFLLIFLTKRRFGVLGLALATGSLLAQHWAGTLTPFLEQQGLALATPPLSIVVHSALVLAPACLLLAGGPTYNKPFWRIAGSLAFALLAIAFLKADFGAALQLDGVGLAAYKILDDYESLIIVVGLAAAVTDVFFTRKRSGKHKDGKKG